MKNITKNTKTILFASLIVAMLLPFSAMEFAEAKTSEYNTSDQIDTLIIKFNSLEVQRQQVKADLVGSNAQEAVQLKKQLASIESQMDVIETTAATLAAQEQRYNPRNTPRAITTGHTIYAGSHHQSCSNWELSSFNTATGTINTGIDIISWDWSVTDYKSVGWFNPFCTDVYFEEITMFVRNHTAGQSCTQIGSNMNVGSMTQTCNCGLNDGDLISWNVETTYESISGTNNEGNDDWRGLHRI